MLNGPFADELRSRSRVWLVTGSAGFIGSNLLEALLGAGQTVVSIDNFATGHARNLDQVRAAVGDAAWSRHRFIEGDIADPDVCRRACEGVELVLHQAALGSVPRSIKDPLATHRANATGFINMLVAAKDAGVQRFVYAASSSTYGDSPTLPKVEHVIGRPLSPYAVTKYLNELYADVFGRCYELATVGLRYFNVFGPRQDPDGAYAAVIPRWVASMLGGQPCVINGDGTTSRDFCFVANAVQANLRAALTSDPEAIGQVYNIAVGERTTLSELHALIADALRRERPEIVVLPPERAPFRAGDVRHSLADIGKAQRLLAYQPTHDVRQGLREALSWYVNNVGSRG
ncbi:MAG TPA: SDR family oxidoreductase [Burkholderiaceae bacterium]|nr:SDR family oxidoreductase [Burkholderiaceae bacterium]